LNQGQQLASLKSVWTIDHKVFAWTHNWRTVTVYVERRAQIW
jgi:hypothetical protein